MGDAADDEKPRNLDTPVPFAIESRGSAARGSVDGEAEEVTELDDPHGDA
jgi:hypothetical protein